MIMTPTKSAKSLRSRFSIETACKATNTMKTRMQKPRPARNAGAEFNAWDHLAVERLIQSCAHELWIRKGAPAGRAFEDWVEAERVVIADFCRLRQNPPA